MRFWKVKNEIGSQKAEIYIYKPIADEAYWDEAVTPKEFAEDLQVLNGKDIVVRINCMGGDVFAAQAIYNQLKRYTGNVEATIDGVAASAATIIAMAADKIVMPKNALFIIHNPMNAMYGYYDETEIEKIKQALGIIKQTIINTYLKKCKDKITEKELSKMMDEETILTADEAYNYGFVDEIDTDNYITGIADKGNLVINQVNFGSIKSMDKMLKIINKEGKRMPNKKSFFQQIMNLLSNEKEEPITATEAAKNERERITNLLSLKCNNKVIDQIIDDAIANGEVTASDVEGVINRIKEGGIADAQNFMRNLVNDLDESGSAKVKGNPKEVTNPQDEEVLALANCLKNVLGKGGK